MIKFRFILLGVLVGILSTIGFQELANRYQPVYPELDASTEALQPENMNNVSSGSFPEARRLQQMRITEQTALNSTNLNVNLEGNGIQLRDTDADGVWDERVVPANQARYFYGTEDGFPVYIKTATNEVVRIDGIYHDLYRQEGKQYIIRDGDKLEVDFSDMDDVRLTPLLDREGSSAAQMRAEIDIRNYQSDTNEADMGPLSIPLNREKDDELMKQGFLPPREE